MSRQYSIICVSHSATVGILRGVDINRKFDKNHNYKNMERKANKKLK